MEKLGGEILEMKENGGGIYLFLNKNILKLLGRPKSVCIICSWERSVTGMRMSDQGCQFYPYLMDICFIQRKNKDKNSK